MSKSDASTVGWFARRSRRARWGLGAGAVLAAIAAAAWFATPWYVHTRLVPRLLAHYGLTVTAERRDVSIVEGAAEFHGVHVFDGKEEVLTAKRVEVRVSLRPLYEGRTIFERVVFDAPVIHVHLGAEGRTNAGRILERGKGSRAAPRPAILWEEVIVRGGTVEWDDRTREVSLRILDVEGAVLDMQTGSGARLDRFGQITIDADLEQPDREPASLSIVHWSTSSGSLGPTFVAHAVLTGIDLDSFPGYVDATQRASLGVDHLDLVVSMDVREGIIHSGAMVATSPERSRPLTLLFGGRYDDPVFDRSSRLFALLELPFSRLGRVGDVVWGTGSSVVGGAGGIIGGVVHGDLIGAGKSAVESVGGGGVAIGSTVLDALKDFGRAVGLVAPEEARDTAATHDGERALFLTARREAAQAWSHTQSERGSQQGS
jgi:hypothetical protein